MLSRAVNRRQFLKVAATAPLAAPWFIPRHVLAQNGNPGANDRVKVGIIGLGLRIRQLLNWPKEMYLQAVCDCNAPQIASFLNWYKDAAPEAEKAAQYANYGHMLDKEKLDGVFVTTPTHVRARPALIAIAAGMHVYAEKPFALTAQEGQLLVKAVRKHKTVFQVGTQARSLAINRWAVEQIHKGAIGKIAKVEVPNFLSPREYRIPAALKPCPAGLDWDLWTDQATLYPCDPDLLGSTEAWGLYRDFDGGGSTWGMSGFGTHAFDQIQWALNKDRELPVEICATETNNPKNRSPFFMKYADGTTILMRAEVEGGPAFGGIFFGTHGKAEINRNQFRTNPADIAAAMPKDLDPSESGHVKNWLDCVRTGDDPITTVEIAHYHTMLCHFGVIAREVKRKLLFDAASERFVNDDAANDHPSMIRTRRAGYELPVV
ncbi:MAG: Gfo/Idh/MocA family oxidoreductase [Planctomycetes bacterium]|nr:Gfo/Idh/MocA family oxidoreductase [Planctomycetota bacterium]